MWQLAHLEAQQQENAYVERPVCMDGEGAEGDHIEWMHLLTKSENCVLHSHTNRLKRDCLILIAHITTH